MKNFLNIILTTASWILAFICFAVDDLPLSSIPYYLMYLVAFVVVLKLRGLICE